MNLAAMSASWHDTRVPRNNLIDIARITAMVVVVTFHSLLYYVSVSEGKVLVIGWAPGALVWTITWPLALLPLFFVAAGYGAAVKAAKRMPYSQYLMSRITGMLGPITLFLAVFTFLSTVPAWLGSALDAVALSTRFAQLLWFLVVYLGLIAATPLMVWLQDNHPALIMSGLFTAIVCVEVAASYSGNWDLHWLNLATLWPLVFQCGIAYQRGWFVRLHTSALVGLILFGTAVIVTLIFWLGYPPSAVAFADVLVANLQPPTLAVLPMALIQICILALLQKANVAANLSARATKLIRTANMLVFSTYLWHIAAIVIADGIVAAVALLWPTSSLVVTSLWFSLILTWITLCWLIPVLAKMEYRLAPAKVTLPAGHGAIVSFGLLLCGLLLIWQYGAVIHPTSPLGTLAVVTVSVAIALCRNPESRILHAHQ